MLHLQGGQACRRTEEAAEAELSSSEKEEEE